MVLVAAAGPAMNIMLAVASAALLHATALLPSFAGEWASESLEHSVILNIWLAIFNLIPLPPLDGGRVAVGVLPRPLSTYLARIEPYGILIVLFVVFILPALTGKFSLLGWLLFPIYRYVIEIIMTITGLG